MDKKISIIIPVYNREHLVKETLDSILDQKYTSWECIIVDDGSTDRTWEVLKAYQAKDDRFRVFQRPENYPKGAPACRNFGYEQSTGDYIQYFDSDDIMLPEMLLEKSLYLELHPEASLVVSKMGEFDENGLRPPLHYSITSDRFKFDFLAYKIVFFTPGPLFRKSFLDSFHLKFDTRLRKNQEREFFGRIILEDPVVGTLDKVHCLRRMHDESIRSKHLGSDAAGKFREKYHYHHAIHNNTQNKYPKVLLTAYWYVLFRLGLSFIKHKEFKYAWKTFKLLSSLLYSSLTIK